MPAAGRARCRLKGTRVDAKSRGIFRETKIDRSTPMAETAADTMEVHE